MKDREKPVTILMAEDDPDDRFLSREALEEARPGHTLYFVEDGEELLDYLRHKNQFAAPFTAPRPGLILLDLNMPRKDGREALAEIKSDPELRCIPVVILTTSRAEEDVLRSYDLGVSGYITKPASFEDLTDAMKTLGHYWFEVVELPPD